MKLKSKHPPVVLIHEPPYMKDFKEVTCAYLEHETIENYVRLKDFVCQNLQNKLFLKFNKESDRGETPQWNIYQLERFADDNFYFTKLEKTNGHYHLVEDSWFTADPLWFVTVLNCEDRSMLSNEDSMYDLNWVDFFCMRHDLTFYYEETNNV